MESGLKSDQYTYLVKDESPFSSKAEQLLRAFQGH